MVELSIVLHLVSFKAKLKAGSIRLPVASVFSFVRTQQLILFVSRTGL